MKIINLLKEGHGLRYAPSPPATDDPDIGAPERTKLRVRTTGFGKSAAVLATVVLLAGGAWWAFKALGPWGPRLAAVRQSLAPSEPQKPPAAPELKAAPAPAVPAAAPAKAATPAATTLPPPPPELTAPHVGRWYRSEAAHPFTVVVASFQKEDSAMAYVKRIRATGHPATVAPTDLGEKGRWYRVVLERYEAVKEAREAADRLKDNKPFQNAWATRLPFAVEVARETNEASAEATRHALAAKGAYALIFPEAAASDQPITFRLLAGAFPSEEQAEAFATTLRKAGISAQVVTP